MAALSAQSVWWPPTVSATMKTEPVDASYAGVPVTPSGSMLPHGSPLCGWAVPRLFDHRTAPVRALSPTTRLRSVAAMSVLPTTSGSPYTAAPRLLVQAGLSGVPAGCATWPARSGVRW